MQNVTVAWIETGEIGQVNRRFILDEKDGQDVRIQLSKKKGTRAKVWHAKVINLTEDTRPRESTCKKGRKKKQTAQEKSEARILQCQEQQRDDVFEISLGASATPVAMDRVELKNGR